MKNESEGIILFLLMTDGTMYYYTGWRFWAYLAIMTYIVWIWLYH